MNYHLLGSVSTKLNHSASLIKVPWVVLRVNAFWITLRLLGSMQQGTAKLRILELTSMFNHHSSVNPKPLYALAHLGCTREAGTS